MTNTASQSGFKIPAYFVLIGIFLLAQVCAIVAEKHTVADAATASFSTLTVVILIELISWAALPIVAFVLIVSFRRFGLSLRLLSILVGLSLITEISYDLAISGTFLNMSSQNFMWATVLCFVIVAVDNHLKTKPRPIYIAAMIAVTLAALMWAVLFNIGLRFGFVYTGVVLIALFLVFYYLHDRENTMMMTAALFGASFGISPAIGVIFLHYRAENLDTQSTWPHPVTLLIYPAMLCAASLL
ncbi:TraX protein [Corynebacterium mustelae]|uniref:TraX protein n=1 Tax=Corynebacterium mustelae TaxID=571915 RepID=A0A0G3GUB9_9CORY|nr:hypothetical protein [Corynebacterium mustelae]AKK04766.1 TraX protein [Corynebacterium mustelae]